MVRKGITSIGSESIKTVKVYGQQAGEGFPVWSEDFEVITEIHPNKSQDQVKKVTATQKTASNVQMLATKGKALTSTASAKTLFVNNSTTRSLGWLLFTIGSVMMGIGLSYDPTVSSGELGIDRTYNIGAINIKSTYTNAGGFIAVCGAIFATCPRGQRGDDSADKKGKKAFNLSFIRNYIELMKISVIIE